MIHYKLNEKGLEIMRYIPTLIRDQLGPELDSNESSAPVLNKKDNEIYIKENAKIH